jgi:hypothetical protein
VEQTNGIHYASTFGYLEQEVHCPRLGNFRPTKTMVSMRSFETLLSR